MPMPRILDKGDLVAVVAPSSPKRGCKDTEAAIRILESAGLRVRLPKRRLHSSCDTSGYLAGPDWVRAAEFNSALRDDEVRAVMCLRGGFGCSRLLRAIDYQAALRDPKPVIGFSDATALLLALYARCGLVTYHGPVLSTLASPVHSGLTSAQVLLSTLFHGTAVHDLWQLSEAAQHSVSTLRPGRACGTLLGGNLSIVCSLVGTPYIPDFRDSLLFLEEVNEPPYRVDRMLTQLELAGILRAVIGVVIGELTGCGDTSRVIRRRLEAMRVPVISGLCSGHGHPNFALAVGLRYILDTESRCLIPSPY